MDDAYFLSIGHGLIGADHNGRIMLVNPEAERLLSWNANEALGKSIEEVLFIKDEQGTDIPLQDRPFRQVLATKKRSRCPRIIILLERRRKFPVTVSAAPILLNNEIIGCYRTFRETNPAD